MFILLTGLRCSDAKTVRWEHVSFEKGTLHRPKPKGGEQRASRCRSASRCWTCCGGGRPRTRCCSRAMAAGCSPARDMDGGVTHVAQVKEQRYVADCKVTVFPSPHRLRDTFASPAHEAGVDWYDLKVLMNHALPSSGDVTVGYVRVSVEHLRETAEKIAAFLLGKMGFAGQATAG
jgi:integrase